MQVLEITNISLSRRQTAERLGNQFRFPVCSWALSPGHTLYAWPAALVLACDAPCCQQCLHVPQKSGSSMSQHQSLCVLHTRSPPALIQGQKHSGQKQRGEIHPVQFHTRSRFCWKHIIIKVLNFCTFHCSQRKMHLWDTYSLKKKQKTTQWWMMRTQRKWHYKNALSYTRKGRISFKLQNSFCKWPDGTKLAQMTLNCSS